MSEVTGMEKKKRKQGGLRTMPFILGNEICDKFAIAGFNANMISYLTSELHLPLVQASNTLTNFGGTSSLTTILGAIIADSFAGRFWTITIGSIFYQLGMITLTVSAILPALRPPQCTPPQPCQPASSWQLLILYASLLLTCIGAGGIRPCVVAFGADQFELWRLSTVHRIEELKSIVRMIPIWSVGILVTTAASHNYTFAILQAKSMDRHFKPNGFQIPAATLSIFSVIALVLGLSLYDRVFIPIVRKFTGNPKGITYLQRIGIGLSISILSNIVAALVEAKRKEAAKAHGLLDQPTVVVPISVFWLVPQYAIHGFADAFTSVGHLEFLYDQSPESMRSMAIGLFNLAGSIGSYMGTALVTIISDATRRRGNWLQDNINRGKLDSYYWLVTGLQVANLLYYLLCTRFYTFKPLEIEGEDVEMAGSEKKEGELERAIESC